MANHCTVCKHRPSEFILWDDRQAYERLQMNRRVEVCGHCASDLGGDRVSPFAFIRRADTRQPNTADA